MEYAATLNLVIRLQWLGKSNVDTVQNIIGEEYNWLTQWLSQYNKKTQLIMMMSFCTSFLYTSKNKAKNLTSVSFFGGQNGQRNYDSFQFSAITVWWIFLYNTMDL